MYPTGKTALLCFPDFEGKIVIPLSLHGKPLGQANLFILGLYLKTHDQEKIILGAHNDAVYTDLGILECRIWYYTHHHYAPGSIPICGVMDSPVPATYNRGTNLCRVRINGRLQCQDSNTPKQNF